MLSFIKSILNPTKNAIDTTKCLVDELGVRITKTTIAKELEAHPDYPNFLSISDVLNNYGVDNAIAAFDTDKLQSLPVPFIALIKGNENTPSFTVIKKVVNNTFTVFDFSKNATSFLFYHKYKFL